MQKHELRLARRARWLVLALACVLYPRELPAYRVEFEAKVDGRRLPGSEICFFAGGDVRGPATLFLSSNVVRCLPADDILDLPAGVWNFYARHEDGWVSAHGSSLVQRGPANPDGGYQAVNVALRPAAYVDFAAVAAGNDRFFAYVPMGSTDARSPAVFPLPAGETSLTIPAGEPFVILRVRDGRPVSAGPLTTLSAAETIDARRLIPPAEQRDVIAWIRIDDSSWFAAPATEAPVVELVDAGGNARQPLFRISAAASAHESFVVFTGVAAGPHELRLSGRGWRTVQLPVERGFVEQPLVARLRQRMRVRWKFPSTVAEVPRRRTTCGKEEPAADDEEWTVALLSCQRAGEADRCVFERSIPTTARLVGEATIDLRVPGSYAVELRRGNARLGAARARVQADADAAVELPIEMPALFGRVTENGRPVQAVVTFETGSALSDETGSYYALLDGDPHRNVVTIAPCDGSEPFHHIPAEPLAGTRQYDIAIPGNRIEVTVVDATTGKAVPHAEIGQGMFATKAEARAASTRGDRTAGEDGTALLRRLQPGYFVRLCATAAGYAPNACAEPIELSTDTDTTVTLKLQRQELRRGRIVTTSRIGGGTLYRTLHSGLVVEEVPIGADGTFTYSGSEPADAIVVASATHPLFVIPHPAVRAQEELTVTMPAAGGRSFTVSTSEAMPNRTVWFTVAVGPAIVPVSAFSAHLTRRGLMGLVEDGGPATVTGIIETAPLTVIAAVGKYPEPATVSELFVLPQYAAVRESRPVPANGRVVFDRP